MPDPAHPGGLILGTIGVTQGSEPVFMAMPRGADYPGQIPLCPEGRIISVLIDGRYRPYPW